MTATHSKPLNPADRGLRLHHAARHAVWILLFLAGLMLSACRDQSNSNTRDKLVEAKMEAPLADAPQSEGDYLVKGTKAEIIRPDKFEYTSRAFIRGEGHKVLIVRSTGVSAYIDCFDVNSNKLIANVTTVTLTTHQTSLFFRVIRSNGFFDSKRLYINHRFCFESGRDISFRSESLNHEVTIISGTSPTIKMVLLAEKRIISEILISNPRSVQMEGLRLIKFAEEFGCGDVFKNYDATALDPDLTQEGTEGARIGAGSVGATG